MPASTASLFPRARPVDLQMPVEGTPSLRVAGDTPGGDLPGGDLPGGEVPGMVAAVVPFGGSKFDTVLFAVRRIAGAEVARLQAGGAATEDPTVAEILEPLHPDLAWRVWERGQHPGDVRIDGRTDEYGRPLTKVLSLMDFSRGLTPSDLVTTPLALRRALAEACQVSRDPKWRATADVLDPGAALRRGRADENEEVFTLSAATQAAADEHDAAPPVAPMRDFRFADTLDLLAELRKAPGVLRVARADLAGDDIATQRIAALADSFTAADAPEFARLRGQVDWILSNDGKVKAKAASPEAAAAYIAMLKGEGEGAGAHFFRDLMGKDGIIETLAARLERPDCHAAFERAVAPAISAANFKLFELALQPQAIRVPRTVEDVARALRARDSAIRLPVLALDDTPMARGRALAAVLAAAAGSQPQKLQILLDQTRLIAGVLREEIALGTRDPGATIGLERLARGEALIARVQEVQTNPKTGRRVGIVEKDPVVETKAGETMTSFSIVTETGSRLRVVSFTRQFDLLKAGERVSVPSSFVSLPSPAPPLLSVEKTPATRVASGEAAEI